MPIQMFNWTSRPEAAFHQNAAAAGFVPRIRYETDDYVAVLGLELAEQGLAELGDVQGVRLVEVDLLPQVHRRADDLLAVVVDFMGLVELLQSVAPFLDRDRYQLEPELLAIHSNMAGTVPAAINKALASSVLGAGDPEPTGLSPEEQKQLILSPSAQDLIETKGGSRCTQLFPSRPQLQFDFRIIFPDE